MANELLRGIKFADSNDTYIIDSGVKKGAGDCSIVLIAEKESAQPQAEGQAAIALGRYNKVWGKNSAAFNYNNTIGEIKDTDAFNCFAANSANYVKGTNCTAFGHANIIEPYNIVNNEPKSLEAGFVIGSGNIVARHDQFVCGMFNQRDEQATFIIGAGSANTSRKNALVIYPNGTAQFSGKITVGIAPSEPQDVTTKGYVDNIIKNINNKIIGIKSSATGAEIFNSYSSNSSVPNQATGLFSHAEGYNTKALNNYAHVEGISTSASGSASHAEGSNTKASGDYSHTEGLYSKASNESAHAEGDRSSAQGQAAHAEGGQTIAENAYTHAEGYVTKASGWNAHAEGQYTEAIGASQHVQGRFNIPDAQYAHIVGGGDSNTNRKNIHTIKWNGDAMFAGSLTLGNVTLSATELQKLKNLIN